MKRLLPLIAILVLCCVGPAIAEYGWADNGIAITASHPDTTRGLWAWSAWGGGGMDVSDISSLQINLPIANEGITGGWKSWGPGFWNPDDGSSVYDHIDELSDWTVEFGNWQSSPNMSYVRWTAPPGGAISLNADSPLLCFYLQVPAIMRPGRGNGYIYLTDSSGNVGEETIYRVPAEVVPEPGSFLALGLGLVPMVGVALRNSRRR